MYLHATHVGDDARRVASTRKPVGPEAKVHERGLIERLEVWCASFSTPGEDQTEFRAFDRAGRLVFARTVLGY